MIMIASLALHFFVVVHNPMHPGGTSTSSRPCQLSARMQAAQMDTDGWTMIKASRLALQPLMSEVHVSETVCGFFW